MALRRPNIGDDNRERLRIVTPAKARVQETLQEGKRLLDSGLRRNDGLGGLFPSSQPSPARGEGVGARLGTAGCGAARQRRAWLG